LVGLEINKGINDEYLWAFHGSVEELHVGGADQQELEQQGLSNLAASESVKSSSLYFEFVLTSIYTI